MRTDRQHIEILLFQREFGERGHLTSTRSARRPFVSFQPMVSKGNDERPNALDDLPAIEVIVADAIASGYTVIAFVIDHENNGVWCANTRKYITPTVEFEPGDTDSWIAAMERIHGGPITSIEQMQREEIKHGTREPEWMQHKPHETWYDPTKPDAKADGPCYCGWLGIDPPPAEWAPPGCTCVIGQNIDDHGRDVGYVDFTSKQMEDDNL